MNEITGKGGGGTAADISQPPRFIRTRLVHLFLILAIGITVYSNTLNVPFVLDDNPCIVENSAIRHSPIYFFRSGSQSNSIDLEPFRMAMLTRPVSYLTFALNFRINGLNVSGYHIFNTLIHLSNALLVYFLVDLLLQSPFFRRDPERADRGAGTLSGGFAFLAAALFVVHPIQTQAVTYIVQRFASLTTFFFLLTVTFYLRSCLSGSRNLKYAFYLISFVSAVLAMLTKEIAFTLPVIIALLELMFLDGSPARRIMRYAPFFLTMAIIPCNMLRVKGILAASAGGAGTIGTLSGNPSLSNLDYLFTEFRVIITYLRLFLLPVNQTIDYNYPEYHSFLTPPVLLSFTVLAAILSCGVYLWHRSARSDCTEPYLYRLLSFGIIWFFVTLSVESSIIPIESVIYEHRMYLPSIGFFLALLSCAALISTRYLPPPRRRRWSVAAAIVIIAALAGTTYARNRVWGDLTSFWEDVVRKNPATSRGYSNLCEAYFKTDRIDDAERECTTAMQLDPGDPRGYENLGAISEKRGRPLEAVSFYRLALKTNSGYLPAQIAIGKIYQGMGMSADAVKEYESVIRVDRNNFAAHYNLGLLYYDLGRYGDAVTEYSEAQRLDPDFAPLYNSLGIAYCRLGSYEKGISLIRKCLQLDPANRNALSNLQKLSRIGK